MSAQDIDTDLAVGTDLPEFVHTPTNIQLFRFSAATWNPHRIHYDQAYAREEGHPGLLVHSHLHAALALRFVREAVGPRWVVTRTQYRMRHPATPGQPLRFTGVVEASDGDGVTIVVAEHDAEGIQCLEGTVVLERAA